MEPGGRASRLCAGGLRLLDESGAAGEAAEARRADLEWLLGHADTTDPLHDEDWDS